MKIAFDTNILASVEGVNGLDRRDAALSLIRIVPQESAIIPAQVLGELFSVLVRKGGRSRSDARDALLSWRHTFPVVEISPDAMLAAADLATDHQLGIWDAVILSTASQAACRFLFSEGFQEGFTWGGVTVVNPLSASRSPLLNALLGKTVK